ncbi:hypothetical protein EZV62_019670 [Acer yangbiense]|uniref:DEK-C domain-containing protein n=1 Tax=Acer yangbiense TaxID=1000413 RepID=A0A5C7HBN6_9ROSI|nr:hypothetical protein EZV62_019670 [Acer yangbiense]
MASETLEDKKQEEEAPLDETNKEEEAQLKDEKQENDEDEQSRQLSGSNDVPDEPQEKNDDSKVQEGGNKKAKRSRKASAKKPTEESAESKKLSEESSELKTEPVTPSSERPTRERKVVERYSAPSAGRSGTKPVSIEKGRGTQLKDIPNEVWPFFWSDVVKLFQWLLRCPGGNRTTICRCFTQYFLERKQRSLIISSNLVAHSLKKNICQFSGYVWAENEQEKQKAKLKEKLEKCVKEKLVDFCDVLNIPINKAVVKKEELSVKLLEFLECPHATTDVLLADKEQKSKKRKKATPSKNVSHSEASDTPAKVCLLHLRRPLTRLGLRRREARSLKTDLCGNSCCTLFDVNSSEEIKKRKQTPQHEEKRKQSSTAEEDDDDDDDKVESPDVKDDSDEDNDKETVLKDESDHESDHESKSEEEEEEVEPEEKKPNQKSSSKKNVKESSGVKSKEKSTSGKKGTPAKSVKSPAKSTKNVSGSTSKQGADGTSGSLSKSKGSASKKKKVEKESKDTSISTKDKVTSKRQSNKSPAKVSSKDQGELLYVLFNLLYEKFGFGFNYLLSGNAYLTRKGRSSKKAKSEPTREEMHAVVVDILKEVDFNTATLSDILRQLGTHFGLDLMHRKAEVKDIITDVINNMTDEEDDGEEDEENVEAGGDSDKDDDA